MSLYFIAKALLIEPESVENGLSVINNTFFKFQIVKFAQC